MRQNYQYLLVAETKRLGNGSWASTRASAVFLPTYRPRSEKRGENRKVRPLARRILERTISEIGSGRSAKCIPPEWEERNRPTHFRLFF